eukprot:TRINITY_DN5474_c0_g3_i2.p1 TRINITY_DN5474_c0_g3~~TRINITY_DN5474_c0_g3_i2.p1  ORF type:complete len:311 (-),score=42.48 TRINITY_DN5474_c0_g3_i2:34-864(-)
MCIRDRRRVHGELRVLRQICLSTNIGLRTHVRRTTNVNTYYRAFSANPKEESEIHKQGSPKREDVQSRYNFSANLSDEHKRIVRGIIRAHLNGRIVLKNFMEAQNTVIHLLQGDAYRDVRSRANDDLTRLQRIANESRARPSLLVPLLSVAFFSLGAVSGVAGRSVSLLAFSMIEQILENRTDDALRELNDNEIDVKDLRKILCQIRDDGNILMESIKPEIENHSWLTNLRPLFYVPQYALEKLLDWSKKYQFDHRGIVLVVYSYSNLRRNCVYIH